MLRSMLVGLVLALLGWPVEAEATRQREELERFDLASLSYWRFIPDACGPAAYVLDGEGFAHRVHVGGYIGKHDGRVVRITEKSIELVELYPDDRGGWHEKTASIEERPAK